MNDENKREQEEPNADEVDEKKSAAEPRGHGHDDDQKEAGRSYVVEESG